MALGNLRYFNATNGLGKIPCYHAPDKNADLLRIVKDYNEEIERKLLEFGGIVFKDFDIRSVSEFNKLANIVSPRLLDYINRSTPRSKLGGKIYTATEYPADRKIPFHHENAYTLSWPNKILFFSVIAAEQGGETPIADGRYVFDKIDSEIIAKFNNKKVLYMRNYIPGIDLSWQETFQTESKEDVEKYCKENSISYEWPKHNKIELITKQICQATINHPVTEENVWFNQAHLFHKSALENSDREILVETLGDNVFPRNAYFGDGSEIDPADLNQIRKAYEMEKIEFKWQRGDIMILDNRIMAHSRNPFSGDRKVVVAMGD